MFSYVKSVAFHKFTWLTVHFLHLQQSFQQLDMHTSLHKTIIQSLKLKPCLIPLFVCFI
jgi:hypothetical protein